MYQHPLHPMDILVVHKMYISTLFNFTINLPSSNLRKLFIIYHFEMNGGRLATDRSDVE
jgi:hypothetical protein